MLEKFKLFESKENYKTLGTNRSYWSWEDDADSITASILLDSDDSLYLKIHKVRTKHGLGAGKFEKTLEFLKFGTIQKAD